MKPLFKILTLPIKWRYIMTLLALSSIFSCLFYQKIENLFVFFPDSRFITTPERLSLHYHDEYFFDQAGQKLHGWFFPNEKAALTILFCHGNAENISHRLEYLGSLLKAGFQVFIFDYQGYGRSGGEPSEKGIYQAGRAAYDHLLHHKEVKPQHVIVSGHSLGAAVAVEIALYGKPRALILESAFTSIREMAGSILIFKPFSIFVPPHYNNVEKVKMISVPILFIHGDRDRLVPFKLGRELYEKAHPPKFFYGIKGAGHNDTSQINQKEYFETIAFFARHLRLSLKNQSERDNRK